MTLAPDMNITSQPLDPDTFSAFGSVLEPGQGAVKMIRSDTVRLSRPETPLAHESYADRAAVEFYECAPTAAPLVATTAESHPHSMQLFAPMQSSRWLVLVWPEGLESHPRAFVARPDQAVLYHPGIWHHGIVALDRPAQFISWMWRTDGPTDTVFMDLPAPIGVVWPEVVTE